ncbi:RNA dependent RNA polymerase-domain-containing protein [Crepidotus variabilis]|uniref:RNA-dependent RNA polymerase n=1 Tax=Crepidotus variabilis TaxID=179855 RepID=A0A9P6JNA7_9AGAR|nr:RNA dependent RNA polymerase-domain-containing protein [Crepidotus variabilis]
MPDQGLEISIKYVPQMANEWEVTRKIAAVLHSPDFAPVIEGRLINFRVKLHPSDAGGVRNNGTGSLVIPKEPIGQKFLKYVRADPIKIDGKNLKFFASGKPSTALATTLAKTPYVDPDLEEERSEKIRALEGEIRVDRVQFGTFYRETYNGSRARCFSVEWQREYIESYASLSFDYDHKQLHLKLGSELRESTGFLVVITFASIQKIAVGMDCRPYICFDTLTPPVLEQIEFHRSHTGDQERDNRKYKQRAGFLDEGHRQVAPYAPHLRLELYNDRGIIEKFQTMCDTAGIAKSRVVPFPHTAPLSALGKGFFTGKRLHSLKIKLQSFEWSVAFQLESLLYNGVLNTDEIDQLIPEVKRLCKVHLNSGNGIGYIGDLLKHFKESLTTRPFTVTPMQCFKTSQEGFVYSKQDGQSSFRCCHVTFTPTRIILEGPYATQSNRIIRRYAGYEDHFLRVDFRDEDRLQYRWDRAVDGSSFVRSRVGGILEHGFGLGGRRFEFLAYSNSALREHAVWFINPFNHPTEGIISAERIRNSVGNFKGTTLLKQPSKYAARIAQAFTATDKSVEVRREEWEEVPDLGEDDKYLFTDGVGTISRSLARRIWTELCKHRHEPPTEPSAYQIRFLGFKGVVAIDDELDKLDTGVHMRLRPSMRKFDVANDDVGILEIAQAFEKPNTAYLNRFRPLVMVLEDLGVRREAFLDLQNAEVTKARTIDQSIESFRSIVSEHSMGSAFKLRETLRRLQQDFDMDLTSESHRGAVAMDDPFFQRLRRVAMNDILRDIKHSARIAVPSSYLLVGIADEGPAYEAMGYENVFCLAVGEIFACIQKPDQEPIWLEGNVSISRSPVAHQGDIQRVRAIGKPPGDMLCLFRNLKNVVVMPSRGQRSLASCLGGGDVDGDLFSVICHQPLLPTSLEQPMKYDSAGTLTLEKDSTVLDICNFIVEYINSDLLGLLSDRLLTIADQSIEGIYDQACQTLAQLCSQAVDYPKQGIPVSLEDNALPRTLIRCKPDWHAAEVVSPRKTDYYESDRALGHLFRAIYLDDPLELAGDQDQPTQVRVPHCKNPHADPITQALLRKMVDKLGDMAFIASPPNAIKKIFKRYQDELRYICATHTLSNAPGSILLEEEAVIGTILAKCSQKRWRSDRIYRMRLHVQTLVTDIQREFLKDFSSTSYLDIIRGLEVAWMAWNYSVFRRDSDVQVGFGAYSFGLIALNSIFTCLNLLEKAES